MERFEKQLCEILMGLGSDIVSYEREFGDYLEKRGEINVMSIPLSDVYIDRGEALKCLKSEDDHEYILSIWDDEIDGLEKLTVVNETGWIEHNRFGSIKTFDNFRTDISRPTFSTLLKAIVYTKCVKDEWSYEVFDGIRLDKDEGRLSVRWLGE